MEDSLVEYVKIKSWAYLVKSQNQIDYYLFGKSVNSKKHSGPNVLQIVWKLEPNFFYSGNHC